MKNKEVCRQCFILPFIRKGESPSSIDADNIFFEMIWRKGRVPCRYFASDVIKTLPIEELIPDSCPYMVEQVVSQNA